MIPLIGTPAHLILPYENKAGEEDPFDFDDATEQRKWKGVEGPEPGHGQEIEHQPRCKPDHMQKNEPGTANKAADRMSDPRHRSLAGLKSLFLFGNSLYVFLDVLGQVFHRVALVFGI